MSISSSEEFEGLRAAGRVVCREWQMAKSIELSKRMRSLLEALEIMADRRLFNQILQAAVTLDEDVRSGKLISFEEAFEKRCPSAALRRPRR
jgi:hypothetical protein